MKRLSEQTLYEILEVPLEATRDEIEAAYERVRTLYAPGSLATYALMSEEEAALLASRIEEAKTTLLDSDARARYDQSLTRVAEAHPPAAVNGAAGAATLVPPVIPVIPAAPQSPPLPAARAEEQDAAECKESEPPAAGARAGSSASPAVTPKDTASRPPIRLDREVSAPGEAPEQRPEPPRSEVSEWTGDALRAAREARGITVQQIADRTKVTRHHIENIEAERFGALPAPVYLRGILLSVSRELRLDGQKVARSYLERAVVSGAQAATDPPKPR